MVTSRWGSLAYERGTPVSPLGALEDGADYVYRINDDTEMRTQWVKTFFFFTLVTGLEGP